MMGEAIMKKKKYHPGYSNPCAYQAEMGGLSNSFRYEIIRLWEHRKAIEEGKLRGLAPLLILFSERRN
jgi:hypothetical protein